ncbi:arginine--tRNA ligase [Hyphobacterium sp. CCMP332]|nr:arginine--tRNA ligase [Hyphobacterium sp. CCMP332]
MIKETQLKNDILNILNDDFSIKDQNIELLIQPTKKEFQGNITIVTFPLTRLLRKKPEEIAESIGSKLKEKAIVADYNVVKGFLNLSLKNRDWVSFLNNIAFDNSWPNIDNGDKLYVVEYSSPNTNKPLHLGHLRNNFLGWSVSELLKFAGNKVKKVQIINDRGIHICKSMLAWKKFGKGETPESSGLKGDKLVGKYYVEYDKKYKAEVEKLIESGYEKTRAEKEAPILKEAQEMLKKWEKGDEEVNELWKKMNSWVYKGFDSTYDLIGVDFDQLYYESETYLKGRDIVMQGLEKGIFRKKEDGSVWVDLSDEGLDEKLLLRADGTSVYMTQDIGTAIQRYEDFPNLNGIVYTVGNEQEYHFKVLFKILEKLGYEWASKCYHLSYGMVDLPSGKMKSREGTVVDADDLVMEMQNTAERHTKELGKIEDFESEEAQSLYHNLGLGALKFFLLKVDPKKRMLFDPEESIQFQGHTGPFIQYTHARIQAILRRAKTETIEFSNLNLEMEAELSQSEREVLFIISLFEDRIIEAAKAFDPSLIANYVYDLSKEYNRFYADSPIFNEENNDMIKFRLALSQITAQTIKKAMGLLGIQVPDKM